MYRYKNLLVGVALDEGDETIVEYADLVSFMAQSDRARFVHVFPPATAFSELYPEFQRSFQGATDELRRLVGALVHEHFEGPEHTETHAEIVEGSPLAELLRIAKDEDTDLVIVGADEDGGTLAEKLARKAPCSVLIVPPKVPAVIERVLVPVDFSDHATVAVDVAVAFAEAAGLEEVHLLHVYGVPSTYLRVGKTYADFHEVVHDRATERYGEFLKGVDLRGLIAVPHFVEGEDVPGTIREQIRKLRANLVMIGTRGRSASAAILLGSVGEQIVRTAEVPVVAVKRKGSTLGLLDALFDL